MHVYCCAVHGYCCAGHGYCCAVHGYYCAGLLVSCIFISLLSVTVGIVYSRTGSNVNVVIIIILFDGENISSEATLFICTNSTRVPPIMIMNRMYKTQDLLYIVPLIRHNVAVCINSMSPVATGRFICVNICPVIVLNDISNFVTSGDFYFKY